jgi:hypothetical protein
MLGLQSLVMDFLFGLLGRRSLNNKLLRNIALGPSNIVLYYFLNLLLFSPELGWVPDKKCCEHVPADILFILSVAIHLSHDLKVGFASVFVGFLIKDHSVHLRHLIIFVERL